MAKVGAADRLRVPGDVARALVRGFRDEFLPGASEPEGATPEIAAPLSLTTPKSEAPVAKAAQPVEEVTQPVAKKSVRTPLRASATQVRTQTKFAAKDARAQVRNMAKDVRATVKKAVRGPKAGENAKGDTSRCGKAAAKGPAAGDD